MPTKKELLAEAESKGLDVSNSNTKAEIEDALAADVSDSSESNGSERVRNIGTPELNSDVNANEMSKEDQQKLEKELSDEDSGIQARVIQSVKNYVKIKWFKDNKPFVTFKSRTFNKGEAKDFLKKSRDYYDV